MLDFAINLLIFFIITAVFIKEAGVSIHRPTAAGEPADTGPLVIRILGTGEVLVAGRSTDVRAVRANVERFAALTPEGGAVVEAQHNASTELLVEVVDQLHLGGIHHITFTTYP